MRHVDEGTIHAWLDGQITDPAEAAWIAEHLRWCGPCAARSAEERATFEQADALLAQAAPVSEPPAFQQLVARAAGNPARDIDGDASAARRHRWLLQAGWAASLVLAVGIGWTARELTGRGGERLDVAATVAQPASAPGLQPGPAAASPSDVVPGTAARMEAAANQVESTAPGTVAPNPPAVQREVRLPQERSDERQAFATEPASRVAAAPSEESTAGAAAPAPPRALAQSPVAAAPPASPPPASPDATEPTRLAPATAAARAGDANASPEAAVAAAQPGWDTLPRTEAAVRSGMALYGIGNLDPVLTAISADRRTVRTVYRLESGDVVELEQQQAAAGLSLQRRASGLTATGRAAAITDTATSREWSDVRGGMRLRLRTTSDATDLPALGTALRVE